MSSKRVSSLTSTFSSRCSFTFLFSKLFSSIPSFFSSFIHILRIVINFSLQTDRIVWCICSISCLVFHFWMGFYFCHMKEYGKAIIIFRCLFKIVPFQSRRKQQEEEKKSAILMKNETQMSTFGKAASMRTGILHVNINLQIRAQRKAMN